MLFWELSKNLFARPRLRCSKFIKVRKVSWTKPAKIEILQTTGLIIFSENRESEILSWVSETPYEKHFKTAKDGLLADSGRWLFEKPGFAKWLQSNQSELFWLRGKRKYCHNLLFNRSTAN